MPINDIKFLSKQLTFKLQFHFIFSIANLLSEYD